MGIFGRKPKVSKNEFSDTSSALYAKGFSLSEVKKFKQIFRGDLAETGTDQAGIDKKEIASAVAFMKKNRTFSETKIKTIEEQLKKRL